MQKSVVKNAEFKKFSSFFNSFFIFFRKYNNFSNIELLYGDLTELNFI